MAEPSALFPELKLSMNMREFHCDSVELRIQFQPDAMNVDDFIAYLKERGVDTDPDEDGDTLISLVFASDETAGEPCHSHLTVRIWKDKSGIVELGYYPGRGEKAIDPPPTVSDCAQWIGSFFQTELRIHVHLDYTFNQSFTPKVSLNFPLPTSDKQLAGTTVSGLALIVPGDEKATAIIQSGEDRQTHLFIRKTRQIDLKAFHVLDELERTAGLVSSLISKTSNESN
jgi:hypothetical protein